MMVGEAMLRRILAMYERRWRNNLPLLGECLHQVLGLVVDVATMELL